MQQIHRHQQFRANRQLHKLRLNLHLKLQQNLLLRLSQLLLKFQPSLLLRLSQLQQNLPLRL
jgi:hypothetical protein